MTVVSIVGYVSASRAQRVAENARKDEQSQRLHAETKEAEAIEAGQKAQAAAVREQTARLKSDGLLYASAVTLAKRELDAFRAPQAIQYLQQCPTELRHWEWHYLNQVAQPEILLINTKECWRIALSPDGGTIASAGPGSEIRLWDAATGASRGSLSGHTRRVNSIAFDKRAAGFFPAARTGRCGAGMLQP